MFRFRQEDNMGCKRGTRGRKSTPEGRKAIRKMKAIARQRKIKSLQVMDDTNNVKSYKACIGCGVTIHTGPTMLRCDSCKTSAKGFDRRKAEALERYANNKATEQLDMKNIVDAKIYL